MQKLVTASPEGLGVGEGEGLGEGEGAGLGEGDETAAEEDSPVFCGAEKISRWSLSVMACV